MLTGQPIITATQQPDTWVYRCHNKRCANYSMDVEFNFLPATVDERRCGDCTLRMQPVYNLRHGRIMELTRC